MLAVLVRWLGFPEQYPEAPFCFWLRENGLLDRVRGAVCAAGRRWEGELHNLYVSPVIASALIEADSTRVKLRGLFGKLGVRARSGERGMGWLGGAGRGAVGALEAREGPAPPFAGELGIADRVGAQLAALEEQRTLLEATDHVAPRLARVAGALRKEPAARHGELRKAVVRAVDGLESDATWAKLDEAVRAEILGGMGLVMPSPLAVEMDEALKRELDRRGLAAWRSEIDAVPARVAKALGEAAGRLGGGRLR